jgi:hypothetical protein
MNEILTPAGYQQTKQKLADLERRLSQLENKTGLNPQVIAESRRSYVQMINQYRRELKLYEASHPQTAIQQ